MTLDKVKFREKWKSKSATLAYLTPVGGVFFVHDLANSEITLGWVDYNTHSVGTSSSNSTVSQFVRERVPGNHTANRRRTLRLMMRETGHLTT